MSWFWNLFKSNRRKAEQSAIQTLQIEVERLQTAFDECSRVQSEWKAAAETAQRERDAVRTEADETIANHRHQSENAIQELTLKRSEVESQLRAETKKCVQLQATNTDLSETIRDRDRQIDQIRSTSSLEIQTRDESIRQLDLKRQELEAAVTSSSSQIQVLKDDIRSTNERSAAQISDLEQRMADEVAGLNATNKAIEQQLAESEARSMNRAEQRSALLRNLTEIHRLSAVASKSDAGSDSLKFVNTVPGETSSDHVMTESTIPKPFYTSRSEHQKSESA